jgi:hypothetical protein
METLGAFAAHIADERVSALQRVFLEVAKNADLCG